MMEGCQRVGETRGGGMRLVRRRCVVVGEMEVGGDGEEMETSVRRREVERRV